MSDCDVEQITRDSDDWQAAKHAEPALHIVQQTNGAEPTEISADIMEEHMKGCF